MDPALHTVVLFEHLQAMLDADPTSPVTSELRRLVEQPTPAGKLGLPPACRPRRSHPHLRDARCLNLHRVIVPGSDWRASRIVTEGMS